mmetsp:Transcript_86638/g.253591  ORF Transcript_86638/g.253591 Transcript_86638/m.253591 type:complete len:117 (-) Transcript_86638:506-856(-)
MWLQPPFLWMLAPHVHARAFEETQRSEASAISRCMEAKSVCHAFHRLQLTGSCPPSSLHVKQNFAPQPHSTVAGAASEGAAGEASEEPPPLQTKDTALPQPGLGHQAVALCASTNF